MQIFSIKHNNFKIGLLVYIFVFLFLEGVARIGYRIFINPPKHETWFAYSPDLMWELKPNFIGNVGHAKRKFDSQGFLSVDTSQINDSKKKFSLSEIQILLGCMYLPNRHLLKY